MATDAEIRAAGLYAVPNRQFLQNEFQLPNNTPTETEEVTESFGIPYTNAFTEAGGGGGQGGGKFGNLNMDTAKQFNINGKTVTGYKNQGSGLYQDIDGLNIQNLGIKAQPLFAKALNAFGFDMDDEDDPKYPGYFTKNKFSNLTLGSYKNFFDRQDKKKQDALQKEIIAANKAAAQSAQLSREGIEKYTGEGQAFEARKDTFTGGKTVDSPSTPGGKYGSPKKDGGRIGYFFGGRVNYKAGGRIRFQGGGRDAGKDSDFGSENFGGDKDDNREQYGAVGQYSTGPTSTKTNDGGVTKPVFYDKNDNIITTDFISKNPNLTINYTDPRNYASLKSKIGFNNILDNDDITAEGDLTGKFGPVSYNTNFTDKGITETNLTAGNFNAKISPDMQLENLSYSKGPFSISSDGKNTKAGLTFSYKNGGLASIL